MAKGCLKSGEISPNLVTLVRTIEPSRQDNCTKRCFFSVWVFFRCKKYFQLSKHVKVNFVFHSYGNLVRARVGAVVKSFFEGYVLCDFYHQGFWIYFCLYLPSNASHRRHQIYPIFKVIDGTFYQKSVLMREAWEIGSWQVTMSLSVVVVKWSAFYTVDPSSNPAQVFSFNSVGKLLEKNKNKHKEAGVGPFLKNYHGPIHW